MKAKPVNPYSRLREIASKFADNVFYRRRIAMWAYPKNRLGEGWSLTDLFERTKAAEQLGWKVELAVSDTDGLVVKYVEKLPARPYEF